MRECPKCRILFDDSFAMCPDDQVELVRSRLGPGLVVAGRFRVDRQISSGGQAVVFEATQIALNRRVALKVVPSSAAADAVLKERFKREALAVARLSHPNIVRVYDFGVDEEAGAYIAMELIEGRPLRDEMEIGMRMTPAETAGFVSRLADAVETAHGAGVVHRDIKPENIFVTRGRSGTPRPVLIDFGIAMLRELSDGPRLTRTGVALGTPQYMSPEQCAGEAPDARSDVYSLGCLAYELFTGRAPFSARTIAALMMQHAVEPPDPPSVRSPGLPEALDGCLLRALEKNPAARQQSAKEFGAEIEAAFGLDATETGGVRRPSRPADAMLATGGIARPASRLPETAEPFFGRTREVNALSGLAAGGGLSTIAGSPGCGKSRLAVEAARAVRPRFPDGALRVDLAGLEDAELVAAVVADALGAGPGLDPERELARFAASRRVLVILDNCDGVRAAAAGVALLLAPKDSKTAVIATSRERLGVSGESVYEIRPLSSESSDPRVPAPAQALFAERFRRARRVSELGPEAIDALGDVCSRLDGNPLALELAAARARNLEIGELAQRIGPFGGLEGALELTFQMLHAQARELVARLAALGGAFTVATATAVCGGEGVDEEAVYPLVARLADKGLVRGERTPAGTVYRLPPSVRDWALARLETASAARVLARADGWYRRLARRAEGSALSAGETVEHARLEAEIAALRAVLARQLRAGADHFPATVASLGRFFEAANRPAEGRAWAVRALERLAARGEDKTGVRSRLEAGLGWAALDLGDADTARRHFEASLATRRRGEDTELTSVVLAGLARAQAASGDAAGADATVRKALAFARRAASERAAAVSKDALGRIRLAEGRREPAVEALTEAVELFQASGSFAGVAGALASLGRALALSGRHREARARFEECLEAARTAGDARLKAAASLGAAQAALSAGAPSEAEPLFGSAARRFRELGDDKGLAAALEGLAVTAAASRDPERALALAAAAESLAARPDAAEPEAALSSAVAFAESALGERADEVRERGQQLGRTGALKLAGIGDPKAKRGG